jgi:hypothetical protein
MFYVLTLAFTNDDKPLFQGETLDDKFESYDRFEDAEDPFYSTVLTKFLLYCSAWVSMKDSVSTVEFQKEMQTVEDQWNKPVKKEDDKTDEPKKDEKDDLKEVIIPDKVIETPKIVETTIV